jgi:hypothetical protein
MSLAPDFEGTADTVKEKGKVVQHHTMNMYGEYEV